MTTLLPVRKQFSPEEREKILVDYQQAKLRPAAFAAQVGVSRSTLYKWIQIAQEARAPQVMQSAQGRQAPLHEPLAESTFMELAISVPAPAPGPTYRVSFPQGWSLEVAVGFNPQELAQLCQILKSL